MKKLIIINGPIGIGKSTIGNSLGLSLNNSIWLDGDWLFAMNPQIDIQFNISMILDNVVYILNNSLKHPELEHIIFYWVLPEEKMITEILEGIKKNKFRLFKFTLLCSEEELTYRNFKRTGIKKDHPGWLMKNLNDFRKYDSIKIDTTNKTVEKIIEEIKNYLI